MATVDDIPQGSAAVVDDIAIGNNSVSARVNRLRTELHGDGSKIGPAMLADTALAALVRRATLHAAAREHDIDPPVGVARRLIEDAQKKRGERAWRNLLGPYTERQAATMLTHQLLARATAERASDAADPATIDADIGQRWRDLTACRPLRGPKRPGCLGRPNRPWAIAGFVGGTLGTASGRFTEPADVAVHLGDRDTADDDAVYVVEGRAANSRVQRLDGDGNFVLAWGRDTVRLGGSGNTGTGYEVCRDAAACQAGHTGPHPGELDRPTAIDTDPRTGAVYVLDGGNGRVQKFRPDGERVGSWRLPESDGWDAGRLAVDPSEPHDVLVTDPGGHRVLRFSAAGDLAGAWGWGLAGDPGRFAYCDAGERCSVGRQPRRGEWPHQITIDDDGVVYTSVFFGTIFEGARKQRTRIVRFHSRGHDDMPLLPPLGPEDPWAARPPAATLTNGTTLGLEIDSRHGRLLVISNPFGTSELDVVDSPGAQPGDSVVPRAMQLDTLPFLQNVNGIAFDSSRDAVYLASGTIAERTGRSSYTGCRDEAARHDCHGLIVLSAPGPPTAIGTFAFDPGGARLAALTNPRGSATYQFEITTDGRAWRAFGDPQSIVGSDYRALSVPSPRLPPGTPYRARMILEKVADKGLRTVVVDLGISSS